MPCRTVHLEVVNSIDTDCFIQSLRRFIARHGNMRLIRCDNGKNFVGGKNELKDAFTMMDDNKIKFFLANLRTNWMAFSKNPPAASHMGRVWEQKIWSCQNILLSMLKNHGTSLNSKSLQTLTTEIEAMVNSRPLTTETLSDPTSPMLLSLANLLTSKTKVIMQHRWRRIQHLGNKFWLRWKKEFWSTLQSQQEWNDLKENIKVSDVVLLKTNNTNQNEWPMVQATEKMLDKDGIVKSVKLHIGSKDNSDQTLICPITKFVFLVRNKDVQFPDRGT